MASSRSARESALRRSIAQHELAAKKARAAAARAHRPVEQTKLSREAKQHEDRARELRVELARLVGSRAPSADVAESNRQRRIEALRGLIAREHNLARQARTVGNAAVAMMHIAEARRYEQELEILARGGEHRPAERERARPSAPLTFTRDPPPPNLPPAKLNRLLRLEREIDLVLKNAATYRDRARRAQEARLMKEAAEALHQAEVMENQARTLMEGRRKFLYGQGRAGVAPEARVGTSAVRAAPGPGDVPLPRAPRRDAAPPSPSQEPDEDGDDASASVSASVSADVDVNADKGGGLFWWIVGGIGVVAIGVAAYSQSQKGGGRSLSSYTVSRPSTSYTASRPSSTSTSSAPKPNPKRKRRNRRRVA